MILNTLIETSNQFPLDQKCDIKSFALHLQSSTENYGLKLSLNTERLLKTSRLPSPVLFLKLYGLIPTRMKSDMAC